MSSRTRIPGQRWFETDLELVPVTPDRVVGANGVLQHSADGSRVLGRAAEMRPRGKGISSSEYRNFERHAFLECVPTMRLRNGLPRTPAQFATSLRKMMEDYVNNPNVRPVVPTDMGLVLPVCMGCYIVAKMLQSRMPQKRVLFCPRCGGQHIDSGEWATVEKAHRTHLCAWCGEEWRPEKVATVGIAIPPRDHPLHLLTLSASHPERVAAWADHKMQTERVRQFQAWLDGRLAQIDESVRMREMMPDGGAGLAETVANSRLFRR